MNKDRRTRVSETGYAKLKKPVRTEVISFLKDAAVILVFAFAGFFIKKLINPYANMITGFLHVPGGISTAFSLMFLVMSRGITGRKLSGCASGITQSVIAVSVGSVGSMGIFMPLAYVIPGLMIDTVMLIPEGVIVNRKLKMFMANIISSVSAAFIANLLVFRLPLMILAVYLCVAAVSGALCGIIAMLAVRNKTENEENE